MMDEFFQEGNIFVVVGASNNLEKYGARVFKDLKDAGLGVIAINNRTGGQEEIQGTPSYVSLDAFFSRVIELFNKERKFVTVNKIVLVLVIPPEAAFEVVKNGVEHGISKVWFQPGAESKEALAYCAENEVFFMHDKCIMKERPRVS